MVLGTFDAHRSVGGYCWVGLFGLVVWVCGFQHSEALVSGFFFPFFLLFCLTILFVIDRFFGRIKNPTVALCKIESLVSADGIIFFRRFFAIFNSATNAADHREITKEREKERERGGGRWRGWKTQLPKSRRCHSNSIYRSTGTVELRGPPLADRNENFPPHLRSFLVFIIALLVLPFMFLIDRNMPGMKGILSDPFSPSILFRCANNVSFNENIDAGRS